MCPLLPLLLLHYYWLASPREQSLVGRGNPCPTAYRYLKTTASRECAIVNLESRVISKSKWVGGRITDSTIRTP
ncbi:hypothetical protein PR202_ga11724 [Eleusine coracana subsp. coracana]|uniref:Secreted protein n=1 Tax=Eleusine coracana subsp. coracana TaxID=191504 RepID=A0AAV5CAB7_ELECO|nr:hypothetical protein PR202_ga11724 [Eleusine coracana subsp. coracana]